MSENLTRSKPPLSERVEAEATVVAVRGELDLQSAPLLTARLDALTAGPGPDLVLDLRDVSFVDCSGLGVLCRTRARALARHGRLRLVTESPGLLRVLRVTGLSGVFELYPRLSDALAGVSRRDSASTAAG
ncbi:STAS domain-containing protein [Streptomyces cupreus]|uniref:Anti-sigma factor antagonist n=1 Tax=Streptomyces cupreus TaxID=2759956 RepID=A0A7X1MAD8_9ACTN|nr:STAS domain-containing protein [Streptomyces cupreus]MBC2904179.1 STAS domain-containing protein [Streptomyces cupreus]